MIERNKQAGQSLLLVAGCMFALLALLGLAIDVGYYRYFTRKMQTAADAAAIAGALQIPYGNGSPNFYVQTAALNAATENGFTGGTNGVTVTVSNPPADPPFNSTTYPMDVEVKITDNQLPTFFSRIFGVTSFPGTLKTSSVAEGSLNCIYALDTTGTAPYDGISLTTTLVNTACGVTDNYELKMNSGDLCAPSIQVYETPVPTATSGTCGDGKDLQPATPSLIYSQVHDPFAYLTEPCSSADTGCGTATFNDPPASCTAAGVPAGSLVYPGSGPITFNGSTPGPTIAALKTTLYCFPYSVTVSGVNVTFMGGDTFTAGLKFSPTIAQTVAFTSNPSVQTSFLGPAGAAGSGPAFSVGGGIFGGAFNTVNFGTGTYVFSGGFQDSGFFNVIDFTANCTYNAGLAGGCASNPTTIIIDGGGMFLSGAVPYGAGVFFYNTEDQTNTSYNHTYGPINIAFGLGGLLQAPTGGTCGINGGVYCAGILYFQDRNNPQPATFAATLGFCFFSCGGGSFLEGAYYFPDASVLFKYDFGIGAQYSFLVAKDIAWTTSATFTFKNRYTSIPNNSPIQEGTAVLVQ
jgi:Flp pilus assembly protein TadG